MFFQHLRGRKGGSVDSFACFIYCDAFDAPRSQRTAARVRSNCPKPAPDRPPSSTPSQMSSATLQASTATVIAVAAGSAACAALITYQLLQRRSSARAQVDESPSTSGAPAAAESRGFSCRRDLFGQEQAPLTPLPALAAPGTVQSPINFKKRQDPYDPTPRAG